MFDMKFNVMSREETVDHILETGCSISRFGDGEAALMNFFSIPFQKHDKKLHKELREVYLSRDHRLLVCVPEPLMSDELLKQDSKDWWKKELNPVRRIFWSRGIKDWTFHFGNTFLTRPYMSYEDKSHCPYVFSQIKKLWAGRNIVMIEGQKSRVGIGNDLFDNASSVRRILGPALDAYSKIDEIEAYIDENISKDSLIMLALGPAATILSYRLAMAGYQSLDVGHLDIEYEWFRMGVNEKVPVKNKYTNEVAEGRIVSESLDDEMYRNQILVDFT